MISVNNKPSKLSQAIYQTTPNYQKELRERHSNNMELLKRTKEHLMMIYPTGTVNSDKATTMLSRSMEKVPT